MIHFNRTCRPFICFMKLKLIKDGRESEFQKKYHRAFFYFFVGETARGELFIGFFNIRIYGVRL